MGFFDRKKKETQDAPPKAKYPTRHGDVTVAMGSPNFHGGELVANAVVDGDVMFNFAKDRPLGGWVPLAALAKIEKDLREVHGLGTWSVKYLGEPDLGQPMTIPPDKIDRIFKMSSEQRIARVTKMQTLPPFTLAQAITDTEVDLARWRMEVIAHPEASTEDRMRMAEGMLGSIESRLRIWIDRHVDNL